MDTIDDASDAPSLIPLTPEQARTLGCLIEKEATTPESYPLTLNSLVLACNQSTNREPVVRYDEATVIEALDGLKRRGYVLQLTLAGARVQKYKHTLDAKFGFLDKPGMALMAVLLLRGIQTSGELRQRTERLHAFADIPSVEYSLQKLIDYPSTPLVTQLPAGSGRKTVTYAQLLCGPVDAGAIVQSHTSAAPSPGSEAGWRSRMEEELAALRSEVAELRALIRPAPTREELDTDLPETDTAADTGSRYIP